MRCSGDLDQRLLYYTTLDEQDLGQIEAATGQLEAELCSAVQLPTAAPPTAPLTIADMEMNDVFSSKGYTQAAWLNCIPNAAWCPMVAIAIFCHRLIGYVRAAAEQERRCFSCCRWSSQSRSR